MSGTIISSHNAAACRVKAGHVSNTPPPHTQPDGRNIGHFTRRLLLLKTVSLVVVAWWGVCGLADEQSDNKAFLETLKIGRLVFDRRQVLKSHSPLNRHLDRLSKNFSSYSNEQARVELEAFERAMIQSSEIYVGKPYSPNIGGWTAKRTEDFWRDYDETRADIEYAVSNLARHGIHADCSTELARMRTWRERSDALNLKSLPVDPVFDQAFNLYREICAERLRLGAQIKNWQRSCDAAIRTADFRAEVSRMPPPDLKRERMAFESALNNYRYHYNTTNVAFAARFEESVEATLESLRKKAFACGLNEPQMRPGHSFTSCGAFGFGGKWQTCLNFNVRNTLIYRNRDDDMSLFRDLPVGWEVAFMPEGMTFDRFDMLDGSWVYAHRDNVFRDANGKSTDAHLEVWWSECAPGILFDAKPGTSAVTMTCTLVVPDVIAGIFGGTFKTFPKGAHVPVEQMEEGWLLFAWNAGSKPKLPVLVYFEKRPGAVEWTDGGAFRICAADGKALGKFAVTTLDGAAIRAQTRFDGETQTQCRKVAALLANFPIDMDEFYAFESPTRLKVWNKVTRRINLSKGWNFKAPDYTPFVPLYTMRGDLKPCEPVTCDAFATRFGFYRAVNGNVISYDLPVPDLLERIPLCPVKGDEDYLGFLERTVAQVLDGSPQSNDRRRGRSGPVMDRAAAFWMVPEHLRRAFDGAEDIAELDMMVSGEWGANGTNLLNLRTRTADYQVDPVSGRGAFLAGWRGNNLGMPIRGDMTIFNYIPLYVAYGQGKLFGRWNLMRRHWRRLKELHVAMDFSQTWRGPGVNTLSSGVIVYGDMFGDGMRSQWVMYRAAKIMGDGEVAMQALYSATKEAATLANSVSPNIKAFNAAVKNIPQAAAPDACIGQLGFAHVGFRTAPWRPYSPDAWNAPFQSVGCYNDYPFYGCLLAFSHEDALSWLSDFERTLPEWCDPIYLSSQRGRNNAFSERFCNACNLIKYKAFTSRNRDAVRALAEKALWPAIDEADAEAVRRRVDHWHDFANVLPHLIAQNDPLWIGDWEDARLLRLRYDRETRTAEIELCADRPATLTFVSMVEPEEILLNGEKTAKVKGDFANTWMVGITAGASRITVRLPEFSVADYPFPSGGASVFKLSLAKSAEPVLAGGKRKLPETYRVDRCIPLDLSRVATVPFSDADLVDAKKKENCWKFPLHDTVRGVPFEFVNPTRMDGRGMVMLRGGNSRPDLPREVKIPVGKRIKRLFFLHGLGWTKGNYFGANGDVSQHNPALKYTIRFRNAPDTVLTMRDGVEIGGWKVAPGMKSLPEIPYALSGNVYPAAAPGQYGEGAGGYVYCWENKVVAAGVTNQDVEQRSLAEISEIRISSVGSGLPIVLAITAEEE